MPLYLTSEFFGTGVLKLKLEIKGEQRECSEAERDV